VQAATRLADVMLECVSPAAAAAAAAADAVEPARAAEGGDARRLLGAVALEVNGGAEWVAGACDGASLRSRRSHHSERAGAARGSTVVAVWGRAFVNFGGATLDDEEPDRGVRPGAVVLAVSLNGGAGFDGGDSTGVPGALAFEYIVSIAVSSLAPRAGPTSAGTASFARLRALARALVPVRGRRERRRRRGDLRARVLRQHSAA
jgi:hypothetical protein